MACRRFELNSSIDSGETGGSGESIAEYGSSVEVSGWLAVSERSSGTGSPFVIGVLWCSSDCGRADSFGLSADTISAFDRVPV